MVLYKCKGDTGKEITKNMEKFEMTNYQFKGIIKMIIALLRKDVPNEEIIEYLEEMIKE